MKLEIERSYSWLKWVGIVITFLIFTLAATIPRAFADDSLIAGITSTSGPAGDPVPTVPVNAQGSVPDQAPQSETPPASDSNFEPNPKPISAPTSPSRISSPPAAKPAAVLIPASASVTSASAAAIPIVDDLFTAVALAAEIPPDSAEDQPAV